MSSSTSDVSRSALGFLVGDVSVRYESRTVLGHIDLDVGPGEIVALVGPSGSGKTTTLRLLNGTVEPSEGCVRIGQEDLATISDQRLRQLRSEIGVISQDLGLVPNLRVIQNVLAGRIGREGFLSSMRRLLLPRRSETEEVWALLERLGIGDLIFQRVDSLSGGERQRVGIARAIYQGARALLADEPFSALDPARARETIELLAEVTRENEMTLVLSMHDIELARAFIPRLVGLREGRVLFDRAANDVETQELQALYRLEARPGRAGEERAGSSA